MPEDMLEEMSLEMSENMSEKDVRKYVFWTVSIELQAPRRLKTDVATAILV